MKLRTSVILSCFAGLTDEDETDLIETLSAYPRLQAQVER